MRYWVVWDRGSWRLGVGRIVTAEPRAEVGLDVYGPFATWIGAEQELAWLRLRAIAA